MNSMSACSASNYDVANVCISENDLIQPPTKYDIAETEALLNDFYITVTIPQFNTLGQLLRWRRQTINNPDIAYVEAPKAVTPERRNPTGRKRKVSIDDFTEHYQRLIDNEVTRKELAIELHISLNTVQLLIREIITGSR